MDYWSDNEVAAIVKDYFDMFEYELRGVAYNKSEHRRRLSQSLNNRSPGSIEYKHQNISAVLIESGMPYISGYKPMRNYQRTVLPDAITGYLDSHPHIITLISNDVELTAEIPSVEDILAVLVAPPESRLERIDQSAEERTPYLAHPVNYLAREAANQSLGNAGEKFILNFERARLISIGKANLADRIEHVSLVEGDAVGYDIHSYEDNGKDRFIEAKTTKYGKDTPFFMSANELKFSDEYRNAYYLYRVFEFRRNPHLFTLAGYLEDYCWLSPTEYMAWIS